MKNQYFGDVNDYRKYGLLRCLTRVSGLSIGVCWLLTEPDGRRDGEFRRYLSEPSRWRRFDPDLYDRLQRLTAAGIERDVRHAHDWDILPAAEFDTTLIPRGRAEREAAFVSSLDRLRRHPILFFDPDNGVEVPSRPPGSKHSTKYIYWRELVMAYQRGHSIVVYQHFPMHVKRDAFVASLVGEFARRLGAQHVTAFRTPHVVFFLAVQIGHEPALAVATSATATTWRGQISVKDR